MLIITGQKTIKTTELENFQQPLHLRYHVPFFRRQLLHQRYALLAVRFLMLLTDLDCFTLYSHFAMGR